MRKRFVGKQKMNIQNKRKIVTTLFGGLGNQLFIYASCRSLSLRIGFELVLDEISGFINDKQYKRTCELSKFSLPFYEKKQTIDEIEIFSTKRRRLQKIKNMIIPLNSRNYIYQKGIDFDNILLEINPKRSLRIEGYWQSEAYFQNIGDIIRNELKIKDCLNRSNKELLKDINNKCSIAIHLREPNKDIKAFNLINLDDYYRESVKYMIQKIPCPKFFVFSEKKHSRFIRDLLKDQDAIFVDKNEASIDLHLMSQCKHFIIADSTFSWWGAWLSKNNNKIIIAPSYKNYGTERAWGFVGLLPKDWILL